MDGKLYISGQGGAQVKLIQFYATEDPKVFAMWVNGDYTGLDVHVRDLNVSSTNDYCFFPHAAELGLRIVADRFILPQIQGGGA